MEKSESLRQLLHAMSDFSTVYKVLKTKIDDYERETGKSVNDLPGFTKSYPFDKSFDELAINLWVADVIEGVKQHNFTILDYEYLNTGGHTMVGIFEVWLPDELRTVYALVNEEGCNLSVVDYIRHELDIDDYDELIFECIDWGRLTGHEKYFELYRHCLNVYTKEDCRYFGYVRDLPYYLLSDELQKQIDDDYSAWLESESIYAVTTDGEKVFTHPDYNDRTDDDKMLGAIKEFKRWHDTTAGCEEYYEETYKLEIAGHKIELPFMADVWDAVDTMLERTINDW